MAENICTVRHEVPLNRRVRRLERAPRGIEHRGSPTGSNGERQRYTRTQRAQSDTGTTTTRHPHTTPTDKTPPTPKTSRSPTHYNSKDKTSCSALNYYTTTTKIPTPKFPNHTVGESQERVRRSLSKSFILLWHSRFGPAGSPTPLSAKHFSQGVSVAQCHNDGCFALRVVILDPPSWSQPPSEAV